MAAVATFFRPFARTRARPFAIPAVAKMSRGKHTFSSYLVTPTELNQALKTDAETSTSTTSRTIPVCGSWFLPNDPAKRTGYQVFKQAHIANARFFDLDKVADTSSPYPHMLPSPEVFQQAMSELGINRDDTVVVYDTAELGIFSAPRVAWTFQVFGHPAVHILNNFKLWVEQGLPTETGEPAPVATTAYPPPTLDRDRVIAFDRLRAIAARKADGAGGADVQILDARSEGRWKGTEPEPRAGLSSGHMPGSTSVPVPDLLDPVTKAFLSPEKLRQVLQRKGVDPRKPVISSCGTGVTATVIETALVVAGYGEGGRKIYDGSWTEWAQRVQPSENLIIKD